MKGKIPSKIMIIGLTVVIAAVLLGAYVWHEENRPRVLEIYVFSLKNGQSMLVRTPDDRRILIDGGSNSEVIRNITKILPFYSRRIDEVIATDTQGKNVSGLIDILERYSVSKVIVPAITLTSLGLASSTDKIYETFIETAKRKKIPIQEVRAGDELILSKNNGEVVSNNEAHHSEDNKSEDKNASDFTSGDVTAAILFPASSDPFQYSKASAPEIVMRISYGSDSVFYLGNVTPKVQKFIASLGAKKSDVLIIPHSASPDGLVDDLMNIIKPKYLVYSKTVSKTSAKSAGRQDQKTEPLFFVLNDKRFNLKEKGTVKIILDGSKLDISVEKD